MEWQSVLVTYGPMVLSVLLGVLAWWLNANKDVQKMKEQLAQIIGDALVLVVKAAQEQMGQVTDEMLCREADAVYDKLASLLPPRFYDLATKLYTKADFEMLVIAAWRNLQERNMVMTGRSVKFFNE